MTYLFGLRYHSQNDAGAEANYVHKHFDMQIELIIHLTERLYNNPPFDPCKVNPQAVYTSQWSQQSFGSNLGFKYFNCLDGIILDFTFTRTTRQ